MIAGKHNFTADFGQKWVQVVTVRDDAGVLINWTGWTGAFSLAAPSEADIEQVEGTVTANASGQITVTIAEDDWVQPGTFKYDLRMQNGTDVQFVLAGSFTVRETVTT